MLVYVAGPYSADTHDAVHDNILKARSVAIELWEAGHAALCPHLNSFHFEQDCRLDSGDYLRGDLKMLARCDAMVILPGYEKSKGTLGEIDFCEKHGIPAYYYPDLPPLHPTEVRCPEQCETFIQKVMGMYRVHLDKNADYSQANVAGCGELGLMTRLWDKISRLMSLMGFNIDVKFTGYGRAKRPKNESVADNLMDAANYALIWQIYAEGKWGK